MINLSRFNEQQLFAITDESPYIKVIAGAGSGKTSVLTTRIAYLIQNRNIRSNKILAITFTNKAANEMKQRVENILVNDSFKGQILTFHSYCLRVLKEDINILGYDRSFSIIDSDDQKRIIKQLLKRFNINGSICKPNDVLAYISNKKNLLTNDACVENIQIFDKLFDNYNIYLKENNAVDFDDLIILCVKLFKENSLILEKWRYRFNYIHVDEFQDTNYYQYELIRLIAFELNLFVVGDPDQTIYTWRGASIDYILNFEEDFIDAKSIKLEYNYRSAKHILDCANNVIVNNLERIDKKLIASIDSNDLVVHYSCQTKNEEALFVVDTIKSLMNSDDSINFSDFAILYRANYISRVFEQVLARSNIDYQIIGGIRFYERQEIKDLMAYLKVALIDDNLSFTRIINLPKRKIGPAMLEKIVRIADYNNVSYYSAIKDYHSELSFNKAQVSHIKQFIDVIEHIKLLDNLYDIFNYITDSFDIYESYDEIDMLKRVDNVNELKAYANTYQGNVIDFIQEASLQSSSDDKDKNRHVSLMSVHAAKGLEFKYVFAVHLAQGIFPSTRAIMEGSLEEERRLAYVCFTRAKKQLYLLNHTYSDYQGYLNESAFIEEIGCDLLDSNLIKHKPIINKIKTTEQVLKLKVMENDTVFKIKDKVVHKIFGLGIIINIEDAILTIAFSNEFGVKKINKNFITHFE